MSPNRLPKLLARLLGSALGLVVCAAIGIAVVALLLRLIVYADRLAIDPLYVVAFAFIALFGWAVYQGIRRY